MESQRLIYLKATLGIVFLFVGTAHAQWPPVQLIPAHLNAGGGDQTLAIYSLGAPVKVHWNGQPRDLGPGPSVPVGGSSLTLTGAELAKPQLATLTIYEGRTNALIATVYVPVAYNVDPASVAVDTASSRLYVATTANSQDPQFPPNSIVAIDAKTGSFLSKINFGASLGPMALSDDGSALYQVVSGSAIKRFDTTTFTETSSFSLPDAHSISSLCVGPGSPGTVAATYDQTQAPYSKAVAVFDSGVKRQNQIAIFAGDGLIFSPDGAYLFGGYDRILLRYAVDAMGLQSPVMSVGGAPVVIAGGSLYTSMGRVIDWQSLRPTGNLGVFGPLSVDPVNNRILQATFVSGKPLLQAFEATPLTVLGQQAIGDSVDISYPPLSSASKLSRFGTDGVVLVNPGEYVLVFHTRLAGPAPSVAPNAVLNSASFQSGSVAPGELVSIFGASIGPAAASSFTVGEAGAIIPPEGNVEVWFDRTPGTVLFNSDGQINAIAPFELKAGTTVSLQVWTSGIPSEKIPLTVASSSPALFTRDGSGAGLAALVNQDGSINSPSSRGSVVTLFGTGGGAVLGAVDGRLVLEASSLSGRVQVSIGGLDAPVLYAGAAPGLVNGVFQINVQIPQTVSPGAAVPVVVNVSGQNSREGVTIEIR